MNNMDDDDEFLYGPSTTAPAAANTSAAPKPVPVEEVQQSTVTHLEDQASDRRSQSATPAPGKEPSTTPGLGSVNGDRAESVSVHDVEDEGDEEVQVEEEEEEEEESDDDDIEIVTEAPARSLDFRQNRPSTTSRIPPAAPPIGAPTQPRAQALAAALTTEYSPLPRGAPAPSAPATSISSQAVPPTTPSHQQTSASTTTTPLPQPLLQTPQQAQQLALVVQQLTPGQLQQHLTDGTEQPQQEQDEGPDPSTLPPVKAPPSHPDVDPNEAGVYNGQSILDFDLNSLADKPWRRPGNDLSDWFNYGFDEISWEAYCYRRRDLGDMAHVLKTNIINFAAMSEDQITALPSDMRGMVITSANTMMNQATAAQQAMMVDPMSGMNMNPNMNPNMNNMNAMGMAGMGQGMMPGMENMMMMQGGMDGMGGGQGVQGQGQGGQGGGMGMQDGMQDGFGPQQGMMGMGDYSMQDQNQMVQPMYQNMDVSQGVQPSVQVPAGRGASISSGGGGGYRNAPRGSTGGSGSAPPQRGRGGFSGRGRGRGGYDVPPPAPVRPASPLPPNVPTGPRNQNKYKDRDNNAPAVDGLDYGGGGGSRRTPSHEPEERSSSRKRRSSPGMDDVRSSKRR